MGKADASGREADGRTAAVWPIYSSQQQGDSAAESVMPGESRRNLRNGKMRSDLSGLTPSVGSSARQLIQTQKVLTGA